MHFDESLIGMTDNTRVYGITDAHQALTAATRFNAGVISIPDKQGNTVDHYVEKYDEKGTYGQYGLYLDENCRFIHAESPFGPAHVSRAALGHMVSFIKSRGGIDARLRYFADSGLPEYMIAAQFNWWLAASGKRQEGQEITARFILDDDVPVLRAFRSGGWNEELDQYYILDALVNEIGALSDSHGNPMPLRPSSYVGVNDMSLNFRSPGGMGRFELPDLPDGGKSVYDMGVYITSSEIGRGALRMRTGFFRSACDNSFVPFASDLPDTYWRHDSGRSPIDVASAMAETLTIMFRDSKTYAESIRERVAKFSLAHIKRSGVIDELRSFADMYNLSEDQTDQLIDMSANYSSNKLGIANAASEFAQLVNPDLGSRIEQSAGRYVLADEFFKVVHESAEAL